MIMKYAPVMIPTLNRLDHLTVCLESLSRCTWADQTEVYIGLDYPPAPKFEAGYKEVKEFLDNCGNMGLKKLHVIKREENYGPAKNFREMQKELFTQYDRLICCDDDIEFSPNFLDYINKGLEKYEDDKDVVAVSAYAFPIKWKVSEGATCLKQNVSASDWGVGYWRDTYEAMFDYLYNDFHRKNLKKVIKGKLYENMIEGGKKEYINYACSLRFKDRDKDYWRLGGDFAMRCYLGIENKFFVSPVLSKTRNHGFDGTGACCAAITGDYGNTAATYDYEHQPIDTSDTFELVEDTLHDYHANRDILDAFDCRTPEEMKYTYRLIWLYEHLGCWAGKCYARFFLPFELAKKVVNRYFK